MANLLKKFIIFYCAFAGSFATAQQCSVDECLLQISEEDYEAIDQLFHILIFENYFAYTLFGSKPMTHKGAFYNVLEPPINVNSSDYIFLTNWNIWKKYAKRPEFKMPNYAFVEGHFPEIFEIHFLNRKNIINCVRSHLSLFQDQLGESITPEKVYDLIVSSEDISDVLGDNHILYGILFGFGKENARGYHEKYQLELDRPDPIPFHAEEQKPNQLPLPYFMVFGKNKETDDLRRTYEQERRQILSLYSKGNFLEITLKQLLAH